MSHICVRRKELHAATPGVPEHRAPSGDLPGRLCSAHSVGWGTEHMGLSCNISDQLRKHKN